MDNTYRIHFSYSKSKRYPQAVELAQLAHKHEVWGEGKDIWHIVTLNEKQGDLMAHLYIHAINMPLRGIHKSYASGIGTWVGSSKVVTERVIAELNQLQSKPGVPNPQLVKEIHNRYAGQIEDDMRQVRDKLITEGLISEVGWCFNDNPPEDPIQIFRQIRELIEQERYSEAVDAYYESLGDDYYGVLTPELLYLSF